MFVDAELSRRIDRVEANISVATAEAIGGRVVPLAEGAAVFARAGSPVNKVLGFSAGDFDLLAEIIERTWPEPVRIELATLCDPEVFPLLSARGYRLQGFENVLVRALDDVPAPSIEIVTNDDAAWMHVLVEGFCAGDGTGAQVDHFTRETIEQAMRDFGAAQGFHRFVARIGEPAGAATMRIDDRVAVLCGAATLPAFRKRGVQSALLAHRLRVARDAGCDVAVITTAPGSLSQKNAMRSGFTLGYARAVLMSGGRAAR